MSTARGGPGNTDRAAVAAEGTLIARGLQYVGAWRGRTVVVKYGGSVLTHPAGTVVEDLVLLQAAGIHPVLVHGGGPEISRLLERLGHTPRFVDGLRVTDEETLEVVEMVLSGRANKALVGRIIQAGGNAVGLSGRDGRLFVAAPLRTPPGLGRVGQITAVHPELVHLLTGSGYIPVIASVGGDGAGGALNLNADHAAAALAQALGASKLIMLTDVEGVYREADGRQELLSVLTVEEARALVAEGAVAGGMIPKVEACLAAIQGGVASAHIISGEVPHALLVELFTEEGIGTMLVPQRRNG
ncbi:MAG: acetylglutamate kinase [Armatimonadota bacterium]|nr:acetylglutamate kinase [Armatimonadota bacterium]MDR7426790.1 acetylglutamate kinase [Armatimonadota bacterium]MDR7464736.1 acetylglutamate kinase [Armatimonadota bacterium]MDR7469880.1 acetylglutamate kinase [Armatimonadota bacterium]MDR7474340.1 acetylglutamate kinase [Armatimonadota bacterium]